VGLVEYVQTPAVGTLSSRRRRKVYRSYLGARDHKHFFESLPLVNMAYDHGFETIGLFTKNHSIPSLGNYVDRLSLLDGHFGQ